MTSVATNISEQERIDTIVAFKHMRPGAFIDLEFNSDRPLRVKGKLIGFEEGSFIILSLPCSIARDYGDIVREGAGCIVRTLVEGEAGQCVAFRSSVEQLSIRPKGLLFISFPKQIESIALRKDHRVTTQLPVTFVHRDDEQPDALFDAKTEISGLIKDISKGGCRIIAKWPEHHSKIQHVPVYIKVVMANGDSAILKAEIKNQHREDPTSIAIGMMFVPDQQLTKLMDVLALC